MSFLTNTVVRTIAQNLAWASIGAAIAAPIAYSVAKKRAEKEAAENIEALRNLYERKVEEGVMARREPEVIVQAPVEEGSVTPYHKVFQNMNPVEKMVEEADPFAPELVDYPDFDSTQPYLITWTQYENDKVENHEQLDALFFPYDGMFVILKPDETTIFRLDLNDAGDYFPDETTQSFGFGSRDSSVVYVRNEALNRDYKVERREQTLDDWLAEFLYANTHYSVEDLS